MEHTQAALDFSGAPVATGYPVPSAPRARRTDPDTSLEAGGRASAFSRQHADIIVAALRKIGEGTIYAIADACTLTAVQVARRLPEHKELFEPTGERGPTPTGKGRVWRLTEFALQGGAASAVENGKEGNSPGVATRKPSRGRV